jgi:hypothetical protein
MEALKQIRASGLVMGSSTVVGAAVLFLFFKKVRR